MWSLYDEYTSSKVRCPAQASAPWTLAWARQTPFPGPTCVWMTQATLPAFQSWLVLWMTVTSWTGRLACRCPGVGRGGGSGLSIDIHTKNNQQLSALFLRDSISPVPTHLPFVLAHTKIQVWKGTWNPFAAWNQAFQVRVPGLGELGFVCLLAAQWVCTSPPFGYLTNTGSPKGFWQSWQSFFSESQMAPPFSFILSYV